MICREAFILFTRKTTHAYVLRKSRSSLEFCEASLANRNLSEWIIRFAPLDRKGGPVLDLAAGGGRHGRYFLERGHPVTLVDRQTEALLDLEPDPRATVIQADLEDGSP